MAQARIYHLALPADWGSAEERGPYAVSTRGLSLADEGFIHCSFAHQIEPVANSWYRDLDELVIIRLDLGAAHVRGPSRAFLGWQRGTLPPCVRTHPGRSGR